MLSLQCLYNIRWSDIIHFSKTFLPSSCNSIMRKAPYLCDSWHYQTKLLSLSQLFVLKCTFAGWKCQRLFSYYVWGYYCLRTLHILPCTKCMHLNLNKLCGAPFFWKNRLSIRWDAFSAFLVKSIWKCWISCRHVFIKSNLVRGSNYWWTLWNRPMEFLEFHQLFCNCIFENLQNF